VGFAGRLYPGKGLDRLIRAVSLLRGLEPDRRVVVRVAGDGEMRAAWQALASELGVGDAIEFLGWCDDIAAHWARCHVAVAPNDGFVESFGMSVLEAMAAGRATVVTDRGALPELVAAAVTGQVVGAGDERALAVALARYARDPAELRAHGAAAHRRAATEYSLLRSAARYLGLATELLDESRAPRAALAHPFRARAGRHVHRSPHD
jgi:glycosyltransferase involved in cell wall biosynthesis